jgi:hypothetical protein
MGFDFTDPCGAYDISCCKGISFWGRKSPESVDTIRFKIGDVNTVEDAGVCQECGNDFGADLGFRNEWKQFTLYFDKLTQRPWWGDRVDKMTPSKVFHVPWQIQYPGYEYDFWIDDVKLIGCSQ